MLTTTSLAATTSARSGSSSSPSASAAVRALRPVTVVTTRAPSPRRTPPSPPAPAPPAAHARPRAEPIAPGETMPTTGRLAESGTGGPAVTGGTSRDREVLEHDLGAGV